MKSDSTAAKIKRARESINLTQAQLAEKVGTTPQNISQYERGIRKPKYETLRKIADAVGCTVYDLVPDDEADKLSHQLSFAFGSMVDELVNARELFLKGFNEGQQEKYLLEAFEILNDKGKKIALERVDELLQIPAYCYYASEFRAAESQRPADSTQAAPSTPDDKESGEK